MNNELSHHGIKGMKWGIRRYQNKDGSLTSQGKKRYDRDVRENLGKKKDNRIDTSNPDPNRWVREDLERKKRIVDTSSSMVRQLKSMESETRPKSKRKSMDLSNMSETELIVNYLSSSIKNCFQKLKNQRYLRDENVLKMFFPLPVMY